MQRLKKIGRIKTKNSSQIKFSKMGLGFEKLDRDAFDPEKAYDKVAETGAKWIRIQSGWAKTETQKGVYNFEWLDKVVDNLISRGLVPWICLCYGNSLYDDEAKMHFGAVGCPPIYSDEAKEGWKNYVNACVKHYIGRVDRFEIWNEPDGNWCWKKGPNGKEYGEFAVETAGIIRNANPDAYIIGGAVCWHRLDFLNSAFEQGMATAVDAVSFHEYTPIEYRVFERVRSLRALCNMYNPKLKIIQGESGSQSRLGGAGALNGGGWTERKQAKQLLRHTVADLMSNVEFTSYFSTLDMFEALNGKVNDQKSYLDYAYFGILGADFDEHGHATGEYYRKPSFYAFQNLCTLFAENVNVCDLPIISDPMDSWYIFNKDCTDFSIVNGGFEKPNGAKAFVYWNSLDLMTTEFESVVTYDVAGLDGDMHLIDPYDGSVYELSDEMVVKKGNNAFSLQHIPIRDYPLILTFGDFAEFEENI